MGVRDGGEGEGWWSRVGMRGGSEGERWWDVLGN